MCSFFLLAIYGQVSPNKVTEGKRRFVKEYQASLNGKTKQKNKQISPKAVEDA